MPFVIISLTLVKVLKLLNLAVLGNTCEKWVLLLLNKQKLTPREDYSIVLVKNRFWAGR